jgi:hypothetical protein
VRREALIQHRSNQEPGSRVDPRRLTLARASDRERQVRAESLLLCLDPSRSVRDRIRLGRVDDEERLAVLVRPLPPAACPNGDGDAPAIGNDQDGIAVAHVPFRSLERMRHRCLLEVGILCQQAGRVGQVLGPAPLWAPPAPRHAARDGDIESRAVYASLTSAHDPHATFTHVNWCASVPALAAFTSLQQELRKSSAAGPAHRMTNAANFLSARSSLGLHPKRPRCAMRPRDTSGR